jgi:hypothetical protein
LSWLAIALSSNPRMALSTAAACPPTSAAKSIVSQLYM